MNNNILKYITIILFFGFIFTVPIITLLTPNKKISEIENKILTPLPNLSLKNIQDKSFMNNFNKYSSDQFPWRENFIKYKNSFSYTIGSREFRCIYINNDNRYMEKFVSNNKVIDKNISQATNLSKYFYDNYKIKSTLMIIPTSIAFYKDTLPSWAISDNQKHTIDYINLKIEKLSTNSSDNEYDNFFKFYSPYTILKKYADLPIYFNTDHHWTQLGARIAYEYLYNNEVTTNSIYNGYSKVSNNFYGTYYSKAMLPNIKSDDLYAYNQFNNFKVSIDLTKNFNTLYDNDRLKGKNKYQYFLHGDPAFAVIDGNPSKSIELLVFKDSFAHSFIPFLTSNYKKIHVVDPRYYHIDVKKYLSENTNIKEALLISNIQTFNSSELYNLIKKN
ncbi:DHHW family protein [Romboutsia lituseburensis]|uniref:DHHW family protein n=1 Tax=Romboutsia lituseburensis TaxID=1537 RepID=UPI00215B75CE|nr:DHHW family protein [Romboutsia lituseburensis]MCR8745417.1 DHHW family protein [Romboutsia lituseburensis]